MKSYSDAFITHKCKVNEVLNINKPNHSDTMRNNEYDNSKNEKYRLPKLNIKPFDS